MAKVALILTNKAVRDQAKHWIDKAPDRAVFTLTGAKRTIPQNARMWAMLTDIARQAVWAGKKRTTADWKDIFTAALLSAEDGLEVVPGLNGGFVLLGLHTSELDTADHSGLTTLMEAWGAQNGVTFSEPGSDGRSAEGGNAPAAAA